MKILVTGNQGYLGPVVCRYLRNHFPFTQLIGFDTGYFADCWTVDAADKFDVPHRQEQGDVRAFPESRMSGMDAVVHLAAISNDPMGRRFEKVTREVNLQATVDLARMAKKAGVKCFVFASSCSIYGVDDGTLKNESSTVHPLTAYAESKVGAEQGLAALADRDFMVTALRFATACGFSARCRLDLVLNDFVASALSAGEIVLLSDGSPWRPLIHVADMARAMGWALKREGTPFLAVNAGSDEWNYQIRDLASAVASVLHGISIRLNPNSGADRRSYRVDFSLYRKLAPDHQPLWNVEDAVTELVQGLTPCIRPGQDFRTSSLIRLHRLSELAASDQLDGSLRWAA